VLIMEFKTLVKARRSCRAFESSAVTDEQLTAIFEAGQWAPSPLNAQPWEFIVITDEAVKTQVCNIGEAARQAVLDKGGPAWAAKYGMGFLQEAPVLIVVTVDPDKGGLGGFFGQKHGALQAGSACIQNMLLAASDMGLETLWFTFFDPEKLREALEIPQHLEVAGILPVGKARESMKAPPRKGPKVHYQRYGRAGE
jgi:5,6-dimethylbenzimidazole synthase